MAARLHTAPDEADRNTVRASGFCTAIAVIAAGRFAEFHAATKAGRDRGDLPPYLNSISGGLDATLPADAK